MNALRYRGHAAHETGVTTNSTRVVWGRRRACLRNLWSVDSGPYAKSAGQRPFLTTAAAVREYVRCCVGGR